MIREDMQITPVFRPTVAPVIDSSVDDDIRSALNAVQNLSGQFIVNDSLWYAVNDKGKVTPCVVNQASFISGRFIEALTEDGRWGPEVTLANQRIDAFTEIQTDPLSTLCVPDQDFLAFFTAYLSTQEGANALAAGESKPSLFSRLYYSLVARASTAPESSYDPALLPFLEQGLPKTSFRIGLEFETGNIASSFRAIQKLAYLYLQNEIDAGVFVTSIDKTTCATRIWPVSNRNGSFQELRQRNYRSVVTFPLWEYGFAPDDFSQTAPYLAGNGTTYVPAPTGRQHLTSTRTYDVWIGQGGKEILQ